MFNLPAWLILLLIIGATARIARLVTADYITRPPREWLIRRAGEESRTAYFIQCDWCVSMWVALPVAFALHRWIDRDAVLVLAAALTASHATGLLARLEA